MANNWKAPSKKNTRRDTLEAVNKPVVSNVKCIRLARRPRYGFGFTLKYCFVHDMKINMEKDDRDNASGSDADISSESDDASTQRPNKKPESIENVVVQWVIPNSPADQAGLVGGEKIVNINNTSVYGKKKSEIQSILKTSASIDVDVVEGIVNQNDKSRKSRRKRWEKHDRGGNQDEVSDNGSSLSSISCSSDNGASPSSLSPPAQASDRCFVVTYGQLYEPEVVEKGHTQMNIFPPLSSYSDEEPQMENKSVNITKVGNQRDLVDKGSENTTVQKRVGDKGVQVSNSTVLKSSTTSSVLVESLDTKPTRVTVTKATYTTLASPQLTRGESGYSSKEDGSDTSDNKLTLAQGDSNIWELRINPQSHVRSRSPSPAHRRVSYLMATEGSSSLASGNWVVKSVTSGDTNTNLVPLKEESAENISIKNVTDQDDSEDDDDDDDAVFPHHSDEYVLAEMNSDPVMHNSEKSAGVCVENDSAKVPDRRHSLKRKISSEGLFEVEKEGYLWRKPAGSHSRRSWKQAYVVLKAHVLYIYKEKPDQITNAGQDEKPISIKSCIVDIAYDYRKRENVFRLTTYNGSQYLFQAEDKDSMMSWIEAIQKNNNPDEDKSGVVSENLIVRRKKNMDNEISSGQQTSKSPPPPSLKISGLKKSLSFKSNSGGQSSFKGQKKAVDGDTNKATWHNKMVNKMKKIGSTSSPIPSYQAPVGVPLDRYPVSRTNHLLPLLVEHCCQVVEDKGLESVGIYRVPGNSANVAALEEELNGKSPETVDFGEPKWNEPNNMGSLLKKFLRKLPEGLVTSELYASFIEANRKEGEERMWTLKHLIQQLPPAYGETLSFIIRHLKKVSEHSDKNKMEIRNLAIVFGPTVVRTGEDNMMTMVNDMPDRFRIVESFITNFDWFFDNDVISNGSLTPTSPPVEELSPHIMSSNMLNSIGQAAVTYESNESNWKIRGTSIKLPNFKNFMKHGSDSSKKNELSPTHGTEHTENGKLSPITLSPGHAGRVVGGSQPNSPTTGRRKFIKRHHSTSNISTSPAYDDFDRSKSEGEDEESFLVKPNVATKAYSYARPPPPSYREVRDKGFRGQVIPANPIASPLSSKESLTVTETGETPDFNSLSEETKKRLLMFTLKKKVSEKKKQQHDFQHQEPVAGDKVTLDFNKGVVNMSFVQNDKSDILPGIEVEGDENEPAVIFEPQLKPNELKKRFENLSEGVADNNLDVNKLTVADQGSPVVFDSTPQVRRREGPSSGSSSRNFKIYSEVNFGQYQPNEINQWVNDMGSTQGTERGRSREKNDDPLKAKRAASVSRSSFVQDENDTFVKRRSASLHDIDVEGIHNGSVSCQRPVSNTSDSTDTSDEEGDVYDASKSFDEKLHHLLQKDKNDSSTEKDKKETPRRLSQPNRPPSYTRPRTSVEKMRALDPTSKIQTGAVSSMKSLFESGAANQHPAKSRSSSISSASSGSLLSAEGRRKNSTSGTKLDTALKKRVWEVGQAPRDKKEPVKWKEPVWLTKERETKNLKSGSDSSIPSDDNNNNVTNENNECTEKRDYISKQCSGNASLPSKQHGLPAKRVVVETKPEVKTETVVVNQPGSNREKTSPYLKNTSTPVKTVIEDSEIPELPKPTVIGKAHNVVQNDREESRLPSSEASKGANINRPSTAKVNVVNKEPFVKTPVKRNVQPPKLTGAAHVKTVNTNSSSPVLKNRNQFSKKEGPQSPKKTNNNESKSPVITVTDNESENAPVKAITTVKNITSPKSSVRRQDNSTLKKPVESTQSLPGPSVDEQHPKGTSRHRRRIVSDTHHSGNSDSRHLAGRTFTAPILGTVVTTTTAFELDRFAIKPQPINRHGRGQRGAKKLEKANTVQMRPSRELDAPEQHGLADGRGHGEMSRRGDLRIPSIDDVKRLSTDRTMLEQNALHIKELLDEMNTEHSMKMERQKSDTISIAAQRSARKKAMRRRHSFGQERDSRVVLASCMTASDEMKEQNLEQNTPLPVANTDLQRNINTVKWVGVNS